MGTFKGVVIAESLENLDVLGEVKIVSTKVEIVGAEHHTPWLDQWTLHEIELSDCDASRIAEQISRSIRSNQQGSWYADFKDETHHYIVFRDRVFFIERSSQEQYDAAKQYGLSLGIPEHQVDFHPKVDNWER